MDCMISDLKLGISKDRMGCHWNQWVKLGISKDRMDCHWNQWVSSCWRCFVAGILCLGSVVLLDDHEVPSSPRLRCDNFQLVWIASAWAKLMSGRERDYIFRCELITCHGYFDRDSVIPVVHRFLNPLFSGLLVVGHLYIQKHIQLHMFTCLCHFSYSFDRLASGVPLDLPC